VKVAVAPRKLDALAEEARKAFKSGHCSEI